MFKDSSITFVVLFKEIFWKLILISIFLNEHSTRCNQVDYISKVEAGVRKNERFFACFWYNRVGIAN